MSQEKDDALKDAALFYHEHPAPGKLAIRVTKPMARIARGPVRCTGHRPLVMLGPWAPSTVHTRSPPVDGPLPGGGAPPSFSG